MLAKAIGLASSPASPEGTSNCLMTIWTGQVFPLWILAQSLCVLPLQVFWDEIGVWRPLRGWLLTFLAKGLLCRWSSAVYIGQEWDEG